MKPKSKVVFLGICAGDSDLLQQWMASGDMPNLRSLMDTGHVGSTVGLPGVYVGSHWPSFSTGCTPGSNRLHSWQPLRAGTYESYRCMTRDESQRPPFWDALSTAGRRVCVLDIPLSYLSDTVNGLQVVEWGAHDAVTGFQTSPPELRKEIVDKFGLHPVSGNSDKDRDPQELLQFRDTLIEGVQKKAALTIDFMNKEEWDFFAQVFTEVHCAGHLLWHLHDLNHPRHGESLPGSGDPLKDVYIAIDKALGQVLSHVDDQTTLIVLANHGMGPKFGAQFLLDKLLVALGVAAPIANKTPPTRIRDRVDSLLTWVWQHTPRPLQTALQPIRSQTRDWIIGEKIPPPTIDPAKSSCFPVQNNSSHGGIRVNLKGREPAGKIAPGDEYDAVLNQLTEDLGAIRNLDTGLPIVTQIYRTDDHYSGKERDHLPDLLVEWSNAAPITAVGSDKVGRVEGEYRYCRTGDHKPQGMFFVKAPDLDPGKLERVVSCIDFAPTIAKFLEVELSDIDGQTISELLPISPTTDLG